MTDYLSFAFVLFGVGLLLFLAEYFAPTGGFLFVAGILVCVCGVGVVGYYGGTTEAAAAAIVVCVGVPLGGWGAIRLWGRTAAKWDVPEGVTEAGVPGFVDQTYLKGRFGRTITPMRPAGTVDFDGSRIDALAEGPMLDANVWVKCVDVKPGRVVVRQVPAPRELGDMNLDDLK